MISTSDITIIGGGAIGLLTAREFINAGATVTILDKNLIGQESSWAGGGILLPLYPWRQADAITRLVVQSLRLYPELAAQLKANTQVDPEWRPCGLLMTKNPDVIAATTWCNSNAIPFEAAKPALYNALNTTVEHPLWLPTIAQIRNPRLLKSLKHDLLNKGVIIHENCVITDIATEQQRIRHVDSNLGKINVNQLIIAAGAWSQQVFGQFFPHLVETSPQIAPVRGQMLIYQAQPETLPYTVLEGDHYLIPRYDGKILVGSTVEQEGFDKSTTIAAKNCLHEFAVNLLPVLKSCPLIKHWAGLRPGTQCGVPYVTKHPEIANLSINAGHFRNGLIMGPASAQLMVDLILNRPTHVDPTPYQLNTANLVL
jgi:glycine oxidase